MNGRNAKTVPRNAKTTAPLPGGANLPPLLGGAKSARPSWEGRPFWPLLEGALRPSWEGRLRPFWKGRSGRGAFAPPGRGAAAPPSRGESRPPLLGGGSQPPCWKGRICRPSQQGRPPLLAGARPAPPRRGEAPLLGGAKTAAPPRRGARGLSWTESQPGRPPLCAWEGQTRTRPSCPLRGLFECRTGGPADSPI